MKALILDATWQKRSLKILLKHPKITRPGYFGMLLFLLLTLYTQQVIAEAEWQSAEYIEKAFLEIALKNEYKKTGLKVVKWQTPIGYQIHYHGLPNNPELERITKRHFKHLAEITGLEIRETKQRPNLIVLFTQQKYYKQDIKKHTTTKIASRLAQESQCLANFHLNKDHSIRHGISIIPVDSTFTKGMFISCLVEENTQLMGLPNDSDWVYPSIANDKTKVVLLTGLDYLMLKILYDPAIKAGMTQEQILPIVRQKIQSLKQQGIIQSAHKIINTGGLNLELSP